MILSVNLAELRTLQRQGRQVRTGIWKLPAEGRVAVEKLGLAGDTQADPAVHGGADKAVYAYAREEIDWWEQQVGRPLEPGIFGENLTLSGVEVSGALVGERWRAGSALLEVSEPRLPCWKLGAKMGDAGFVRSFAAALRPGAYLRVIEEGDLAAGDPIELVERPEHDVSMRLIAQVVLAEPTLARRLLEAPQLSEQYRQWAVACTA